MAGQDTFSLALTQNKSWAQKTCSENPTLFPTLANGQYPQILWIGCSDSRIPETTVLGLQPGDVFVHRNIANILHPGDLNSLSVISFAIVHLKVAHVVVCGHTSCGGVNAALANQKLGFIDAWLLPLRSLRMRLAREMEGLSQSERAVRLVEANVRQGVQTLKENADVIEAIRERGVVVHGLVYDVACGELKELEIEEEDEQGRERVEAFGTSAEGGKGEEKPQKETKGVGGSEKVDEGYESLAKGEEKNHEGLAHHRAAKQGYGGGSVGAVGGA